MVVGASKSGAEFAVRKPPRSGVATGFVAVLMLLAGLVSGCQMQGGGAGAAGYSLAGGASQTRPPDVFRFVAPARVPTPGSRPYSRIFYSNDVAVNVKPNPKIDALTGREVASLPPVGKRRLNLPFSQRSRLYNDIIRRHARANGIDYDLARAIIYSESSFRVNALGSRGEIGLMQIKPSTAREMGFRGRKNDLYVPETNIKWGMRYLRRAKERSNGTICGMILKYNAGLYAKRMNPVSARYCAKVKRLIRTGIG